MSFSRLASEGDGPLVVSGMGFQPTTLWIFCRGLQPLGGGTEAGSWGFAGSDGHGASVHQQPLGLMAHAPVANDNVIKLSSPGSDEIRARVLSLDPDGFTLRWDVIGDGFDAQCSALGLR